MKKCFGCNDTQEGIDKYPRCSVLSTDSTQYNDNKTNDINISLDFTYIECNCGGKVIYNKGICEYCGCSHQVHIDDLDPRVKLRIQHFEEVLNSINDSDIRIRKLKKEIRNDIIEKVLYENYFELIQNNLEELSNITERKIFRNISFKSYELEQSETNETIIEIKEQIEYLYKIYEELLVVDSSYIWQNAHIRMCNIIRNTLESYKLIIRSIVSETLNEASDIMEEAQNVLNIAIDETKILSNIINIKNLETKFELYKDGNVNTSALMLMMMDNDIEYFEINEGFNQIQLSTYNYFKNLLTNDFEYYASLELPVLFKLSHYRFMSIASFVEYKFIKKTKIVVDTLDRAKDINFYELKNFISRFKSKYIYSLKILDNVVQDSVAMLSYHKSEEMLIRNAMKWYKDLSEGAYRDFSSILIACAYIIDKKNLDYENILEWMGFTDKLSYLENKRKLKFDKLTDGIEKVLRHSEAHVDFTIDDINKSILVRNKLNREKKTEEIEYTYEEFLEIYTRIQETICSIVTGLNIFFANNYDEFNDFLLEEDREMSYMKEESILDSMFSFIGIVDIEKQIIREGDSKNLIIEGVTVARRDRELLEKCISCVAPIFEKETDLDKIIIKIVDEDKVKIGSTEILTKYMKRCFELDKESKYRKYEMLLINMTTKINYLYYDYTEKKDFHGFKLVSTMLQWCMDLLERVKKSIYMNKEECYFGLNSIKEEVEYGIATINEYSYFIEDKRLLSYTNDILNDFINCINKYMDYCKIKTLASNNGANTLYRKICNRIADIFGTLGRVKEIEILLESNVQIKKVQKFKIGRNDPCTCGSGKKYKKCCLP